MSADAASAVHAELNVCDVGVVVITYNSTGVVGGLLETLEAGLIGVEARVVFVDNASSDGTVAEVQAAGYDVIVCPTNGGYSAAINRGMRHFPNARSILVLNPDVRLSPRSVAAMYGALTHRTGIVAPKMYVSADPPVLELSQRRDASLSGAWMTALLGRRLVWWWPSFDAVCNHRYYAVARDVDWAVGAALLMSRERLNAVGDWDESYFLYSEEADYCQRARDAGFAVRFTPDAVVVHPGGDGLVDPRLRAMMAVNRVRLFRRRHGALAAWCFLVAAVLHEGLRALTGNASARHACVALLVPGRRPAEIGATSVLPR